MPTVDRRHRGLLLALAVVLELSLVLTLVGPLNLVRAAELQETEEERGPGQTEDVDISAGPPESVCDKRFGRGLLKIPYCSNKPLDQRNESVQRAVVVIHGNGRDAAGYYGSVRNAANTAGAANTTVIVAPQFLTQEDVAHHRLLADILFWTGDGWKQGDNSRLTSSNPRTEKISSFTITERVLRSVASRDVFPNLREIVLTGHSAGGQFVNRFAAGSRAVRDIELDGIQLKYVIANPSSYLYFTRKRRAGGSTTRFEVPDLQKRLTCPTFNRYKYGLEKRNDYMKIVGAEQIKSQYASRKIVYLLGGADTQRDSDLDKGCQADLQGRHRLARGEIYYNYLGHLFGPAIYTRHVKEIIPGASHSASEMYNSEPGRRHLFGTSPPAPPTPRGPALPRGRH